MYGLKHRFLMAVQMSAIAVPTSFLLAADQMHPVAFAEDKVGLWVGSYRAVAFHCYDRRSRLGSDLERPYGHGV